MFTVPTAVELLDYPIAVPADFLGVNAPDFSQTALKFKHGRIHDMRVRWCDIERVKGQFNWAPLDSIMAAAGNMSCSYVFGGTAPWAAKSTAIVDEYGAPGGSTMPTDVNDAANFLAALIARYPGKFNSIQAWGEITPGYWDSTPEELVTLVGRLREAAKAAGIKFLSPAFSNIPTLAARYLSARSMAGVYGWQSHDVFCVNPYTSTAWPVNGKDDIAWTEASGIERIKCILTGLSGNQAPPIHVTEWGIAPTISDSRLVAFLALPAYERKKAVARMLVRALTLGVQRFNLYSHCNGLCGDLLQDVAGVIAACNEFAAFALGKTVISVTTDPTGRMVATRADGAQLVTP